MIFISYIHTYILYTFAYYLVLLTVQYQFFIIYQPVHKTNYCVTTILRMSYKLHFNKDVLMLTTYENTLLVLIYHFCINSVYYSKVMTVQLKIIFHVIIAQSLIFGFVISIILTDCKLNVHQ